MEANKEKADKPIGKEAMDLLQNCVGKTVTVEHVWYGVAHSETGTLLDVDPFVNIEINSEGIPFVGYGSAIRKISTEEGTVYENKLIPKDYDLRRDSEIDVVKEASFGTEIARKFKDDREAANKEWEEQKERLDKKARSKSEEMIKKGSGMVKPELVAEWGAYAKKNTQDFYSAGVVSSSLNVMEALSDGKPPKEAMDSAEDGITGFQAGCIAQTVVHFHSRGDEFRLWWNERYGVKNAKGVVNPAILTIRKAGG